MDAWKEWENAQPVAAEADPDIQPDFSHDEDAFQDWYGRWATVTGLDPNPDAPEHQYDYRAAWKAGVQPEIAEDGNYHWDSRFKAPTHPNRIVDGVDTITGANVLDEWNKATPVQGEEVADPNEPTNFLGGALELAKQIPSIVTEHMPKTFAQAWRGGRKEAYENSALDAYIEEKTAKDEKEGKAGRDDDGKLWFRAPFTGQRVTYGDARDAAENIGYSVANMLGTITGGAIVGAGAGAAAGALTGPAAPAAVPLAATAGAAIGGIGTGVVLSGEATKDQFVDTFYKAFLKVYPEDTPQNRQLWRDIRSKIDEDADWYGFWEAAPETVGNVLTMGLAGLGKGVIKTAEKGGALAFMAPLKKMVAEGIGESIAAKLGMPVAKFGASLTEEMLTEAWTQMKQSEIEVKYGLRDKPASFTDALGEVYVQTLINTATMGGGMAAVESVQSKVKSKRAENLIRDWTDNLRNEIAAGTVQPEDIRVMIEKAKPGTPTRKALESLIAEEGAAVGIDTGRTSPEDLETLKTYLRGTPEFEGEQEITVQAPAEVTPAMDTVSQVAQAIGAKVRFYQGEGKADELNGAYDPASKTIFINANASDPYLTTMGHESLHLIADERPDLYEALRFVTDDQRANFDTYLKGLNDARKARGMGPVTREEVHSQEYLADFAGQQFINPEFWTKLHRRDPSLGERLAEIVVGVIDRIRNALRSMGIGKAEYYRNLNQVQDALAITYSKFARGKKAVHDATAQPVVAGTAGAPARLPAKEPGAVPGAPGAPSPAGPSQGPPGGWDAGTPVKATEAPEVTSLRERKTDEGKWSDAELDEMGVSRMMRIAEQNGITDIEKMTRPQLKQAILEKQGGARVQEAPAWEDTSGIGRQPSVPPPPGTMEPAAPKGMAERWEEIRKSRKDRRLTYTEQSHLDSLQKVKMATKHGLKNVRLDEPGWAWSRYGLLFDDLFKKAFAANKEDQGEMLQALQALWDHKLSKIKMEGPGFEKLDPSRQEYLKKEVAWWKSKMLPALHAAMKGDWRPFYRLDQNWYWHGITSEEITAVHPDMADDAAKRAPFFEQRAKENKNIPDPLIPEDEQHPAVYEQAERDKEKAEKPPEPKPAEPKPMTKKEKSAADLKELIDSLTDEERTALAEKIKEAQENESPTNALWKLRGAVDKYRANNQPIETRPEPTPPKAETQPEPPPAKPETQPAPEPKAEEKPKGPETEPKAAGTYENLEGDWPNLPDDLRAPLKAKLDELDKLLKGMPYGQTTWPVYKQHTSTLKEQITGTAVRLSNTIKRLDWKGKTSTPEEVAADRADLEKKLATDLQDPKYQPLNLEGVPEGRSLDLPHSKYANIHEYRGRMVAVVWDYNNTEPSYFRAEVMDPETGEAIVGVGNTRDEAVDKAEKMLQDYTERRIENREKVWTAEELDALGNPRIREIAEARDMVGAKTARIDTLKKMILDKQAGMPEPAEDGEIRLAGTYPAGKETGDGTSPDQERAVQNDLRKYAKALQEALGLEPNTDKRGKPRPVTTNIPPAGGDGTIMFWQPGTEYGVYVSVSLERDYDTRALKVANIMWRLNTREKPYTGLANRWADGDISAAMLAERIKKELDSVSKPKPVEKPEAPKQATSIAAPDKQFLGTAEKRIAKLLHKVLGGIQEKILQGEDYHLRLENPPYLDLVIERHTYPGNRAGEFAGMPAIYLTHYIEDETSGDTWMDGEMVYVVTPEGALSLVETAVQNVTQGGELRGADRRFANIFAKNLLAQGFDKAKERKPLTDVQKLTIAQLGPVGTKVKFRPPAWNDEVYTITDIEPQFGKIAIKANGPYYFPSDFELATEQAPKAESLPDRIVELIKRAGTAWEMAESSILDNLSGVKRIDGKATLHGLVQAGRLEKSERNGTVFYKVPAEKPAEEAPAAPEPQEPAAPTKFVIGDIVRPRAGSGLSDERGGRVQHIKEDSDGNQRIKTENSGTYFDAKDWEIVEPAADVEGTKVVGASALAEWVSSELAARTRENRPITWQELFAQADKAFGGTQAEGKYTPKDAYDALELGINLSIYESLVTDPRMADPAYAQEQVASLKKILDVIPTQSKRTEEQLKFQQFSTPPPFAYVANWVANLKEDDTYLEPSAGIGGLAVFAFNAGITNVYANELSRRRANLLVHLPFAKVFTEDAEQLNNILPKDLRPTVIVMNPPFSATGDRGLRNKTKYGANHIEQALKRLAPNGRLVAIVGQGMSDNAPAFREWWKKIKAKYNVRANIAVSGEEYRKYGTTFSNQLLVIDKTGPTAYDTLTGFAEKIEDLVPLLEGVRRDRAEIPAASQPDQRPADQQDLSEPPATPQGEGGPAGALPPATPGVVPGQETPGPGAGDAGQGGRAPGPGAPEGGLSPAPGKAGRPGGTKRGGRGKRPGRGDNGQGEGPQPGGSGGIDTLIDDLLGDIDKEAEKQDAEAKKAPAEPEGALITKTPIPRPPADSTISQKKIQEQRNKEAQAEIDKAAKDFNDLFASIKREDDAEAVDPAKWEKVHDALSRMWSAFKKQYDTVYEAAKAFVQHSLKTLSTKGKAYIKKFYQEDVRADLEAEQKLKQDAPPKELDYTDQGKEGPTGQSEIEDSLFSNYAPKINIPGAKKHPATLVQSVAMADTELPEPKYKPILPKEVIESGKISDAQLEAVVYANQSFETVFPDGRRRGFFIGDGTGVGKGREIASIIWENALRGRKKAVWISEKPGLMKDAARDINGVGWDEGSGMLFTWPKRKKSEPAPRIKKDKGILFASYSSLRINLAKLREDQPETLKDMEIRVAQLVDWLGRDFDGVIAFDESHNMRNATAVAGGRGSKPPSLQALAGIALTKLLPKARVLYVSATGAVEIENLVYADRMGLWGEGTPFSSSQQFMGALTRSGIAGMEMIARDLKSRGLYLSRSLSYQDVEYDRMLHSLDDKQRAMYDELARAWQIVLQNIKEAIKACGGKKSTMWSQFWGSQQRFFNSVVTAMQMPSVLKQAQIDLDNGQSVIFQLTSTGEAVQDRQIAGMEEGQELEDLDLSPREGLIDFLRFAFPVQQFEDYIDDNGNPAKRPVFDSEGKPVLNEEAVQMREELIARIGSIKGIPASPLDMIVHHFGADNVAEVTARGQRMVHDEEGKLVLQPWSKEKGEKDAALFMDHKKRVLVFSEAGGTGASYHADLTAKNQEKRVHYLLQSGWNAVRAVQGLGRSHRSNQKQAPKFWLVTTDIRGQMRFISTIARRLDQLGALTKGQRQAGSQGIFQARDNLESSYAREAVVQLFEDIQAGAIEGIDPQEFGEKTGLKLVDDHGQPVSTDSFPETKQFLNRMLVLELEDQNRIFDAFSERIDSVINRHAEAGTLDVGIETITGETVTKGPEQIVHTDESTNALTKYVPVNVGRKARHLSFEDSSEIFQYSGKDKAEYYQNIKSGRVWVGSGWRSRSKNGQTYVYKTLKGPAETAMQNVDQEDINDTDKWRVLDTAAAGKAWDKEYANLPAMRSQTHHMLTGSLLPIWDRLQGSARIFRMQTDEGERILGREIPESLLDVTLDNLGVGRTKEQSYTPEQVVEALQNRGDVVLVNGWEIKPVTVSGDERFEIKGPDFYDFNQIKNYGVFSEVIQYRTRFFIPTDERAARVIARIIEHRPVRTIRRPYAGPLLASVKRPRNPQTDTIAFKEWFGNSYVVDKNGEPLVVYHGTARNFDAFDEGRQGEAFEWADGGFPRDGFWFSDSPSDATGFARNAAQNRRDKMGDRIIPAYLSLQNPFMVDVTEYADEGEYVIPEQYELERQGFDGIIVPISRWPKGAWRQGSNEKPRVNRYHYVAFKPTQIKSAIGNSGAFSQMNESLIASVKREIPTNTDTFKMWFKGSKVKKRNGKPVMVFHGTDADVAAFITTPEVPNEGFERTEDLDALAYMGAHFTKDAEQASSFAGGEGGRVVPAYLNIQRPYITYMDHLYAELHRQKLTHPAVDAFMERIDYTVPKEDRRPSERVDSPEDFKARYASKENPEFARHVNSDMIADLMAAGDRETLREVYSDMADQYRVFLERHRGFDGIRYDDGEERESWIAFYPQQIKSVFNARPSNLRREIIASVKRSDSPWYSQMAEHLEAKLPGSATREQLVKLIQGWVKAGQIKAEEVDWSGIISALESGPPAEKLTKDSMMDWLEDENIRIEEHLRIQGEVGDGGRELLIEIEDRRGYEVLWDDQNFDGDPIPSGVRLPVRLRESDKKEDEYKYELNWDELRIHAEAGGAAQYLQEEYNIPYSDALLILKVMEADWNDKTSEKETIYHGGDLNVAGGTNYRELELILPEDRARSYAFRSSHYNEKNILAHVRFDEREDTKGRKILFIQEIQSDWHEKAFKIRKKEIKRIAKEKGISKSEAAKLVPRDYGYKQAGLEQINFVTWLKERGIKLSEDEIERQFRSDIARPAGKEIKAYREYSTQAFKNASMAPQAPFKNTWPMLIMKRMVRWAAENNFDAIAWTTGEQQNARYDLSKKVDYVSWEKNEDMEDPTQNGTYNISAVRFGNSVLYKEDLTEEELEDHLGKAIAEKIIAGEGRKPTPKDPEHSGYRDWRILEGEDLKVGGKGMEGFYDVIVPNEVNRFFNKPVWGNAKVSQTGIETDIVGRSTTTDEALYEVAPVHFLEITPQMRERALEKGMPLFSVRRMSPVGQTYLETLKAAIPDQFVTSPDIQEDIHQGLRPEVKDRLQLSKGVPTAETLDKTKRGLADVWHMATRHRPYLDPKKFSSVADILRTHQETYDNSIRRAIQVITGIVQGMKPKQYEAFSLHLIMQDMMRDVESGLLSSKETLPFGFTQEEARAYADYLADLVSRDEVVSAAIERRQAFQEKFKGALVDAGILGKEVMEDDRYWHHQVLMYQAMKARGEEFPGLGMVSNPSTRMKKQGWQFGRTGSVQDYNTHYVESEFEVLAQGFAQLETREVLDKIESLVNIAPTLRSQVKEMNRDLFYQLFAQRNNISEIQARTTDDPLKPFAKSIAMGYAKLAKLARDGEFTPVHESWNDVLAYFEHVGNGMAGAAPMIEQSRMFAFLGYLMRENLPGASAAGMIRKAVTQRAQYIKSYLGDKAHTVRALMLERFPDYVEWKPAPRTSWYRAWTLPDRLIDRIQSGDLQMTPEVLAQARKVLARGKDAVWIIPRGVAKTMEGFDKSPSGDGLAKWGPEVSRKLMNSWKAWTLLNPFRFVKYNLNNMSGDLDIAFAYDPRIISKYLPGAIRDLYRASKEKNVSEELQAEIDMAHALGVIDSGWSVQEVGDVAGQLAYKEHMEALRGERPNIIKAVWRDFRGFTQYRENLLRLAAFRYFKEKIAAGETVYGASDMREVDGISDPMRKAAKLSRELIGDYGNITHAGKFIRAHMLPFYSWMEINAPRYVRLLRNLPHEGRRGNARAAAALGKQLIWGGTKLGLKMNVFFILVNLWNLTMFPDEEDEIGEAGRKQLHLILGRNPDGTIRSMRLQGAFSDALSWFGAENAVQDARDIVNGKKTWGEWLKEAALATPRKIINALRPDLQGAVAIGAGRTWYPDPFNPRPVRDKIEYLARTFSLNTVYDWLAGKPKRGGDVGGKLVEDLMALGLYNSDPGEQAYWDVANLVRKYREAQGKEEPAIVPKDKANALYYYKQGLRYGDLTAAEKYLREYYRLGGNPESAKESVERAEPLGGLAKKDRAGFLRTLGPHDREVLELAKQWYREHYLTQKARQVRAAARRPVDMPTVAVEDQGQEANGRLTLQDALKLMK